MSDPSRPDALRRDGQDAERPDAPRPLRGDAERRPETEGVTANHAFDIRLRDAKLAAMAEFCAGAGHEINNPAAAIHGRCSLLLRNCGDPALARELRVISEQALRIRDMIADALLFADPPPPRPEPVWLGEIVEEALPGLRERAADAGCEISVDVPPVALNADPEQLAVVAASLGRNAIEAGASRLRFRGRLRGGKALLWVADDGAGFTEQERTHAFDPFFSGRQAGRGLGFGLPKCWRIVTLHHGTLDVRSSPGRTVFRASLPALPADAAGPTAASA